jgi:hypothetical protein
MFVQVIEARVSDADGLRNSLDSWQDKLQAGATGWLGTTGGITDDGRFIALARFESQEAARANSDRPEQGEWFAEISKYFDGEPDFLDCGNVQTFLDGGSDDAGFVQVMRGRSEDVARMNELFANHDEALREGRPEILGGTLADAGDGRYTHAIYFRSEQAAREGEAKEPPADVRAALEEAMQLMGEATYFDLKDPILRSP